jgi:hypothetical protein
MAENNEIREDSVVVPPVPKWCERRLHRGLSTDRAGSTIHEKNEDANRCATFLDEGATRG